MSIIKSIWLDQYECKRKPLWFHERGLMQTASGYGRKLVTDLMVKYENKWRRVYCCIFSNAGTCYILQGKDWIVCDGEPSIKGEGK